MTPILPHQTMIHRTPRISPLVPSIVVATLLAATPALEALQLRVYSPTRHDRFTGFPGAPVANGSFIHAGLDLTGVGWRAGEGAPRSVTLVSPKYVVLARHYRPPLGSTLRFVAADGTVRDYTIETYHDILNDDPPSEGGPKPCDVALAELVETVAATDGVHFQPYLNLGSEAAYLAPPNNQLIVLGKSARGGIGVANSIADFFGTPATSGGSINNTRTIQFTYQNLAGSQDDAFAETGDSGSPILVASGGRGALVGVHSAVVTALGSTTTVDSFVAHPPYIEQINAIMATDGYHMTEANPASLTLTATPAVPPVVRAGYPAAITFTVGNTDGADDANNLKLACAVPPGSTALAGSGDQWLAEAAGDEVAARRGGLAPSTDSTVSISFTPSAAGSHSLDYRFSADEFAEAADSLPVEVLPSFLVWSAGLADPAPDADPDGDRLVNLLEYAFGGDPDSASAFRPDGTTPLAPAIGAAPAAGEFTFRFLRRRDFAARALTYGLESSATLEPDDWNDAGGDIVQETTQDLDAEFEEVTWTVTGGGERAFYRLAVTLDEAP